jgi:DNA-binding MarR family transcriptional regulator
MSPDEAVRLITELYPALYHRLHTRWDKDERRPTAETLAVLGHLELTGPLTISEAARHFDRAQSAMSELIDRLERSGHVTRFPDARDRRRTLVWMTETGLALLRRSRQVLSEELLRRALEQMTDTERRGLVRGLQALIAAADQTLKPSGAGDESQV